MFLVILGYYEVLNTLVRKKENFIWPFSCYYDYICIRRILQIQKRK